MEADGPQRPEAIRRVKRTPGHNKAVLLHPGRPGERRAFMNAAWEQVGDVIEANRRSASELAQAAALSWHRRHLVPLETDRAYLLTAPLHQRVLAGEATIATQVQASVVPATLSSPPFRKLTRPGTALTGLLALPPESARRGRHPRQRRRAATSSPQADPPAGARHAGRSRSDRPPQSAAAREAPCSSGTRGLRFARSALLVVLGVLASCSSPPVAVAVGSRPWRSSLVALFELLSRWNRAKRSRGRSSRSGRRRPRWTGCPTRVELRPLPGRIDDFTAEAGRDRQPGRGTTQDRAARQLRVYRGAVPPAGPGSTRPARARARDRGGDRPDRDRAATPARTRSCCRRGWPTISRSSSHR